MSRMGGKPRNWFEATLIGVGFPVLFVALVLAAATPSARAFQSAAFDMAQKAAAGGSGTCDDFAVHPSRALADRTGWELYLHSATMETPGLAPSPAGLPLSSHQRSVVRPAAAPVVPLPLRISYRPQAPPA